MVSLNVWVVIFAPELWLESYERIVGFFAHGLWADDWMTPPVVILSSIHLFCTLAKTMVAAFWSCAVYAFAAAAGLAPSLRLVTNVPVTGLAGRPLNGGDVFLSTWLLTD